jgi:hypothetical protein
MSLEILEPMVRVASVVAHSGEAGYLPFRHGRQREEESPIATVMIQIRCRGGRFLWSRGAIPTV